MRIERMDGTALRAAPARYISAIMDVVDGRGAVIAKNYLTREEVRALRNQAESLATDKPACWSPYFEGCPDFHHYDFNDAADDARRRNEGRPLRPRRFHLHKFLPWNVHPPLFDCAVDAVIALRNAFYGQPPAFAKRAEDGIFTVPQVLHYEKGGDYLDGHSDQDFHLRQGLSTKIELITLLSARGVDFDDGGLFIVDGDHRVMIEDDAGPGDVVMYDVRGVHGCAPVDPAKEPDPSCIGGRWVLLVPPYLVEKHLRPAPSAQ